MTLQYKLAQPALSELFLERISFSQNNFQALFGVLWRKQRHVWNAHRTMHTRREGNEPSSSGLFYIVSTSNRGKNDLMKRSLHVLEQKTNVIEELLIQLRKSIAR